MRLRLEQIKPTDDSGGVPPDGQYAAAVVDGVLVGLEPVAASPRRLVPLTTSVGGVPQIVWDDNDEIVWTEIPL